MSPRLSHLTPNDNINGHLHSISYQNSCPPSAHRREARLGTGATASVAQANKSSQNSQHRGNRHTNSEGKRKRRRGRAGKSDDDDVNSESLKFQQNTPNSRDEANPKTKRPKKKRKSQPSEAALKLSEQLKDLSRQKKLREALSVYWNKSNDSVRDGHHGCIVVDCCARCGDISVRPTFTYWIRLWLMIRKYSKLTTILSSTQYLGGRKNCQRNEEGRPRNQRGN